MLSSAVRPGPKRLILTTVARSIAIALGLALLPLAPYHIGAAHAAAPHKRAAGTTAQAQPYSGTAEWTIRGSADQLVPARANDDLGVMHATSAWAVADSTHFRIETKTSSPPLETQTSVYAANGGPTAVWYRDIYATALHLPLSTSTRGTEFLSGGALPMTSRSVQGYVDRYNHLLQSGGHARLLGPRTYLGRTADVVEVRPVSRTSGSSCTTGPRGKQRCKHVTHAYGRELIWIDREHLVIVKVRITGLPRGQGGNYSYAVTSMIFGQTPAPDQLAFTAPVPITNPPDNSQSTGSTGSLSGDGTGDWSVPPGFIGTVAPIGPRGHHYALAGSGQTSGPGGLGVDAATAIYTRDRPHGGALTSPFVLVQERRRANGPPPLFATGTRHAAGRCIVVTGTFPDGLHWLGLARTDIYVLVSSDSFSEGLLVKYAATRMCR